jgi:hypothetical protein
MATLVSEDQEYKSYFEIRAGKSLEQNVGSKVQTWQYFSLTLANGERVLNFTSPSEEKQDYEGFIKDVTRVADGYLLCRAPKDEVGKLVAQLEKFNRDELSKLVFEPVEPSFELMLERQHDNEIRASVFVDEGNVLTTIARWDSLGLRFFTNQMHVKQFIDELKRDFGL